MFDRNKENIGYNLLCIVVKEVSVIFSGIDKLNLIFKNKVDEIEIKDID